MLAWKKISQPAKALAKIICFGYALDQVAVWCKGCWKMTESSAWQTEAQINDFFLDILYKGTFFLTLTRNLTQNLVNTSEESAISYDIVKRWGHVDSLAEIAM